VSVAEQEQRDTWCFQPKEHPDYQLVWEEYATEFVVVRYSPDGSGPVEYMDTVEIREYPTVEGTLVNLPRRMRSWLDARGLIDRGEVREDRSSD
jgi:hypothetical protein